MNAAKSWWFDFNLNKIKDNLEKRNFEGYIVENRDELIKLLKTIVKKGSTVSVGGSVTLFETKVIDFLRSGDFNFLDRYAENLKPEDIGEIFRKSFWADYYFMSSSALTTDGKLINIDGNGNRLAALLYGPKNVVIIVGINKIVLDEEEGLKRVRNITSPMNCKRLNKNTPCVEIGKCADCLSNDCICSHIVVTRRCSPMGRIKVIIVKEDLGF